MPMVLVATHSVVASGYGRGVVNLVRNSVANCLLMDTCLQVSALLAIQRR